MLVLRPIAVASESLSRTGSLGGRGRYAARLRSLEAYKRTAEYFRSSVNRLDRSAEQ